MSRIYFKKFFTEEELQYIIVFFNKKIEDINIFNEKYPVEVPKGDDIKGQIPCDSEEYKKYIKKIKINGIIPQTAFIEIYCFLSMVKNRDTLENELFLKVAKIIKK